MIYERGTFRVEDKTSPACHRQLGGCVLYLNNRLDGQAREEGHAAFANMKYKSETGQPDERTLIADCTVHIVCPGPPARRRAEDCHAEFKPYWSFEKSE